jgi:hypothetical protein
VRKTGKLRVLVALGSSVLLLSSCGSDTAPAPSSGSQAGGFDAASYFKGKTIRFIVSHSAGGGADLTARSFANALGNLVPGNPRITVTNDSGLGGIDNAYAAPEQDLVVGVTGLGTYLSQPMLDPSNNFDPKGIQIIGAVTPEPRGALVAGDFAKAYPKIVDATGKTEAPIKFAATVGGPVDVISEAMIAPWVCEKLNLPCDMLPVAEDGSSDTDLMLQRGEVNSNFTSIGSISRAHRPLIEDRSGYVAFSYDDEGAQIKYPDGTPVPPQLGDIIPADAKDQWETIQPLVTGDGLGKTFWMGPQANPDVVKALQQAWSDFIGDKDLYGPFEKIQTGGSGEGGISFTVTALPGPDAQKRFDASTEKFRNNLDAYKTLQTEIYDKWWKS